MALAPETFESSQFGLVQIHYNFTDDDDLLYNFDDDHEHSTDDDEVTDVDIRTVIGAITP